MLRWLYHLGDRVRHSGQKRWWPSDHAAGRHGEDLAHRFLEKSGLAVVGRNYHPSYGPGEIDLVAWDGDTLVFVEVKARATDAFGSPELAVGNEKQDHLRRAARDYARCAGADWQQVRFDIVTVVYSQPPAIEHIRDAFRVR
jgi:putative endonuclease